MPYSFKGFFEIEINEDMKILLMLEVLFTQDSCKFVWSFYTNSLLVPEKRDLTQGVNVNVVLSKEPKAGQRQQMSLALQRQCHDVSL